MVLEFAKEALEYSQKDEDIRIKGLQDQITLQAKQIMLLNKRCDLLLEIVNIDKEQYGKRN